MNTYARRRGMADIDDAGARYKELLPRRFKGMPRVGDKAVLSDHKDACVYTITEVAQRSGACGTFYVAQLMYVNDAGMQCNAGGVDVASLLIPSDEQLNAS